ncbi:MAG: hypothetical protein IJ167_01620, partial [Lachnospiraceae bacterium]|nr:hypothetical protein [Lachnospiraceae bacterium]
MDKLRKSTLFKVIIIIVFMVSLLASAISGIVSVSLYVEHALTKRGKEGLKNEIIESIAPEYNEWAREYYQRFINGENTYSDHDFFSEENMNYAFKAQVIGSATYPMLTNYETEDYQYKNTYFTEIKIDEDYDYYEHKLSKKDIVNSEAYMMLSFNDVISLGLLDADFSGMELWYESDYDDVILINANLVNTLREDFINKNGYDYFRNDDLDDYKVTEADTDSVEATTAYDYDDSYDYSEIYYDYEELMYYGDGYEYVYHDYSDFYDVDKQRDKID